MAENSTRWLCEAGSSSKCALQRLILRSCDLSCPILASALLGSRTLLHLCLSNNSLRTEEVRWLCQFVRRPGCALPRPILNRCNLRDTCGFLALLLFNSGKLTHLSLNMNPVEDGGLKLLCDATKEATCHLQELELVGCQLTGD